MDLQAYYIQAAKAAAPAVHAEDDDDVVELTPKAMLLKLDVQTGTTAGVTASYKGSGLSPLGLGNAEAGSGSHDLTCPECGKTFLSDKAMYGHLRSHPDRGYKGASRPATANPSAVAADKKPRKVPLKEAVLPAMNKPAAAAAAGEKKQGQEDELSTKWPVTAKRGRASSTPSGASAPVATVRSSSWCISEEVEAAMILLEMASSGTTTGTQRPLQPVHTRDAKNQIPDVEQLVDHAAQNQMPELQQQMLSDHVACSAMAHQTPEAERQIVQPELAPEAIAESQTPEVNEPRLEIPTKPVVVVVRDKSAPANQQPVAPGGGGAAMKREKRRVMDSEKTPETASPPEAANVRPPARRIPSPASDKKYECPTCGKSFPSHQALGGHMSGHNKSGSKHVARHDELVMVQAMQNILAQRKKSSNSVGGGTGAAAFAGEGREGSVTGAGHEGAISDAGQVDAVTFAGHESAVGAGGQEERHDVQPPASHVCPDCSMAFSSGQALGGHKRKHWFPEKQQARAAIAAASSRTFDLNELPSDGEGENQP